ncbi:ABC transporter permease [Bailinhaonella thermotolerans]|uniref:ABC transporter permease n=1 Tax=Bailinhaonella thermotolerans TaxID=1070861 RepID=UPI001F5B08D3|nr:ABC transporter permease [Bailinhaonella thermotolerans]
MSRTKRFLIQSGVVLAVLLAWEFGARAAEIPWFPPPGEIAVELHKDYFSGPWQHFFLTEQATGNWGPSLLRLVTGWALASLAGVFLGIALGRSGRLSEYFDPVLQFGRAIPPPMLIPFFIVLLELGPQMHLATIVFGVIWPVLINSIDGARYVDRQYMETAEVFGVSRADRLFRVILPAAAPKIFAGLRLSLSLSLILLVLAEMTGSTEGLGHRLLDDQRNFEVPGMWGGIILLGVLGVLLNTSFLAVERRVLAWHLRARQIS